MIFLSNTQPIFNVIQRSFYVNAVLKIKKLAILDKITNFNEIG